MKNLKNITNGRKTYISITVLILGLIGAGSIVTEADVAGLIDSTLQIIGIIGAIYGRYDASRRYRASIK